MDESNFGGPKYCWIDNGKDYSAWMFHGSTKSQRQAKIQPQVDEPKVHGIFNALKIEAHFAIPYGPNGKARLETWFRNLTPFAQTFESYAGMSVESKPERLAEVLKNPRKIPPSKWSSNASPISSLATIFALIMRLTTCRKMA